MKWFHKCDPAWLEARQKCLTATDVKELLPVTKTGRKRTVGNEAYLKVFARKIEAVTADDAVSTGAAARGHVLEPYAIDRYNAFETTKLHHWDDVVIIRPTHRFGMLGFSPDAMSIPMPDNHPTQVVENVESIGEVKCYAAENHMIRGYTPKDELEERWQLATAMAVCDSISEAKLIFFNPSLKNEMFVVDYRRADLAREIETILDVEEAWLDWLGNLANLEHNSLFVADGCYEKEIVEAIMKAEELNPEGEKSVML